VQQEKEDAMNELEDEFENKLEDARRRDEIEAEQERREQEAEEEDEQQQNEDAVPDVEGDQPANYYKGLSDKEKKARAKYFKRGGGKGPAPGDEDAKTKPSKHTKKYKEIYGEEDVKSFKDYMTENKALQNKADETGAPKSILKKVYDRGLAAYKQGHRPGATAAQWGMARVNSFLTYGKGTAQKADKDLFDELPDGIQKKIKNNA